MHWTDPYQALLVVKIAVVAAMIVLASTNCFRFTPRIKQMPLVSAAAIRRGAIAEIALGLAAIALVAVFGMLDPGM